MTHHETALHHLDRTRIHTVWDASLPPQLTVAPGDTVVFETLDASYGQAAGRVQTGEQPDLTPQFAALIAASVYPE